ncbi:MAG TPA: hypothetical protein VL993_15090 [Stellaceae bacterium]|nr:hypothetical protein [Stellaceae bacterium]
MRPADYRPKMAGDCRSVVVAIFQSPRDRYSNLSTVARIIWDRKRNPTKHVSDQLGIERRDLRQAIHKIKARSNLGAADRVIIYDDGSVTDEHGDHVGNILDEV